MVSSFGLKHGNERTVREFLRIHPDEHPVSMQLFGHDADGDGRGGRDRGRRRGRPDRPEHGLPRAQGVQDGRRRRAARRPRQGGRHRTRGGARARGLPVTVKLRPGLLPGDRAGVTLARRLVEEAGVAGIAFHPRHASQQHKGRPDYALAAELVEALEVPVIVSGGLLSDERAVEALERTGAEAVMLARGSLGNPWRFERLLGQREGEPTLGEVVAELEWVIERAEEHLERTAQATTCASSTRGTPSGWT